GTVEDARRGHHACDLTEIGSRSRDRRVDRALVAHIAGVCPGRFPDQRDGFGGVVGVPVEHGNPRAFTRRPLRGGAPDAAAAARDDDRPAESHGRRAYEGRSVRRMSPGAHEMHSVAGKVIIVTGSGRGVGKGMALHLGKGDARIVVAEWKPHLLEETCAELDAIGVEHLGVVCDIQHRDQIDAMVASTVSRFGRVDALINNAQTFRPLAAVADVEESDVDVFYTSGVKGTLWAMQAVYPHMKAQQWGRIVNFASSMGITGGTGFAAYNA